MEAAVSAARYAVAPESWSLQGAAATQSDASRRFPLRRGLLLFLDCWKHASDGWTWVLKIGTFVFTASSSKRKKINQNKKKELGNHEL